MGETVSIPTDGITPRGGIDTVNLYPYEDVVHLVGVTREVYDHLPGTERRFVRPASDRKTVQAYIRVEGALEVWTREAPTWMRGVERPLCRPPTPGGDA